MKNITLNLNNLLEEYKLLQEELTRTNELYDEVRTEKENNKKASTRVNYVFVAAQNSTLNSLISQRVSIISKMNDIKKIIEELRLKEFNINKGVAEESGSSATIIRELLTMINTKTIDTTEVTATSNAVAEDDVEPEDTLDDLDSVLAGLDAEEVDLRVDYSKLAGELVHNLDENELILVYDVTDSKIKVLNESYQEKDSEEIKHIVNDQHRAFLEELPTMDDITINDELAILENPYGLPIDLVTS